MRRIVLVVLSTLTVLVLLFGYHTSTQGRLRQQTLAVGAPAPGSIAPSSTPSGPSASTPAASPTVPTSHVVTGPVAQTQWGPVQVQLLVRGTRITKVGLLQYPNGTGQDLQINSYALPILIRETISGQGHGVDMVSGATVTSDGYLRSLQGALDQAHL